MSDTPRTVPGAFTLRVPFEVASGRRIEPGEFEVLDHQARLVFRAPFHILTVHDVPSEEEAERLLPRIVAALKWAAIETSDGIRVNGQLQNVTYREDGRLADFMGVKAHGLGNEGAPAIYPSNKVVRFAYVPSVTAEVIGGTSAFADRLRTGLGSGIHAALADETVNLAVDVLTGSFFEPTRYAWFLGRVTVLEILKEQSDHPLHVRELIDSWKAMLQTAVGEGQVAPDVGQSISSGLERLKKQSIGQAIAELVERATSSPGDVKEARALYNVRSKAVHEGSIDSEEVAGGVDRLTKIVLAVVKTVIKERSGSSP